ncbi:hypothetical protein PPYR_13099 [Photinus pyralis]|uniref:Lin-37 DREAM MuvB core complex component n=1 Tax=Photinus pyralis TaxID=7054 RepID=A0A1Y1MU97_PHOPY|nr:protein lin-37 homolog [Photinus pyralis]XP_031354191.1 protein lin-37 homolog [Photinus pyralis]KAB0793477.1 hypothetical protein PPYR_13097 [Photinus pyralis]KAB0793479.1 hypothetical protein PPYR_13099 [Photinus pyralis]
MTKNHKMSSFSPVKVEVKEENLVGHDYLIAKGRLKGVLRQLTEQSDSDSDSVDEAVHYSPRKTESRKRKIAAPVPVHHTYVMKLFDRSVDLARFEEDTPLYPICRAWMANLPRNPQVIVKRRLSSPEPDSNTWSNNFTEINRLPRPSEGFRTRIPSPLPAQLGRSKDDVDKINFNYEDKSPLSRDILIPTHLRRWRSVKKKWISTAQKNESRYEKSMQILQTIYNKAQETMDY